MMIPCEGCLIYAICRNKKDISCSLLFNWMNTKCDKGEVDKLLLNWRYIDNGFNVIYVRNQRVHI